MAFVSISYTDICQGVHIIYLWVFPQYWSFFPPSLVNFYFPNFHWFIRFLYQLNLIQGCGIWSLSQLSLGKRQGHQSITGPHRDKWDKQPHTLTLTPQDNLETPINLTCMFLDGGRKLEFLGRTHAYTGRTCTLHTERHQLGIKTGSLLLWVLTTRPPCSPLSKHFYSKTRKTQVSMILCHSSF